MNGNPTNVTLTSQEVYNKRKIKIAVYGMLLALLASISNQFGAVNSTVCITKIFIDSGIMTEQTVPIVMIYSMICVGIVDLGASIYTMIYCGISRRNPIKEVPRTAKLKVSWFMCLATLLAGPLATSFALASYNMCGLTVGCSILALTPLFVSIMSKLVFKENLSPRVYLGICILVMGTIVASYAPFENMPNFYAGVVLAVLSALFFALEGIASTYAADMIDEYIGCGLFRLFGSFIMCMIVGYIVGVATGNQEFFKIFFTGVWKYTPWLIVLGGLFEFLGIVPIYAAFVKCGPARCQAVMYTSPIWSIFVGLGGAALISTYYSYTYTLNSILGAIIAVVGIVVITCKPSELLNLRDVEE